MAKFCGNCGTKLDDSAKICGICGAPLESDALHTAKIPGIEYVNPEKKEKIKKTVKLVAVWAAIVVAIIVVINIISGFVGYKGATRKFMKAYEKYDMETIVSMASELYFYMDEDEEDIEDLFASAISYDLDTIEEYVGHKYKLSYEILESYNLSDRKYKEFVDEISDYLDFEPDMVSKIKVVELDVIAKGKGNKNITLDVQLVLTKEDGGWKILYIS